MKVAAVTGAGKGLGRETAIALSRAGFAVAMIGRTLATLEQTGAMLAGPYLAVAADLTDPDQVRGAFGRIAEELGGVDVLVNNAASYAAFPIDQASDGQILDVIHQSLVAPIFCIRAAIPLMRARGAGDIVNISTQSVDVPQPYMIVYGAAKAGVEALSRGLRYELRKEPIRTIVVNLGAIAGTVPDAQWLAQQAEFGAALKRSGLSDMFILPGTQATSIAATIVHAVTAPRDAHIQTIEIRGMDADG